MLTRPSGSRIPDFRPTAQRPKSREFVWGAGLRWAFGARAWMGFFVSLTDGRLLLRHELTWIHTTEQQASADIKRAMKEWRIPNLRGGVLANDDLWPDTPKSTGESRAETFMGCGIPLRRGSKDRLNQFARLRSWLEVVERKDAEPSPSLLIHPACKYFLRTLPVLVSSSLNVDDVAECPEEYPAVGASLYVMSRPLPTLDLPVEEPGEGTWGPAYRSLFEQSRGGGLRERYRFA
jgi:hypothetical protein